MCSVIGSVCAVGGMRNDVRDTVSGDSGPLLADRCMMYHVCCPLLGVGCAVFSVSGAVCADGGLLSEA